MQNRNANLTLLAELAVRAHALLRVLVLSRDAKDLIVSTAVHRTFFRQVEAAQRIVDGGTELLGHLAGLDPTQVACVEHAALYRRAEPRVSLAFSDKPTPRLVVGATWRGLAPFFNMRADEAGAAAATLEAYGTPKETSSHKKAPRVKGKLVAKAGVVVGGIRTYCRRLSNYVS